MGDGFAVDLDGLNATVGRIQDCAARVGEAATAGDTTVGANQLTVAPHASLDITSDEVSVGTSDTIDMAFGLICQPFGIVVHAVEDPVSRALDTLAERLRTTTKS